MNALISAFKDKQKIMFANEGRLLKKSFFGLLILVLAFQTGDFGDVIRESMVNAYLAVSVFVGFTLIVFIGLDSLTNFDIGSFLDKTKKLHEPIASFLGAIPGCGGAIIVVTQYIQGRISFGSLNPLRPKPLMVKASSLFMSGIDTPNFLKQSAVESGSSEYKKPSI